MSRSRVTDDVKQEIRRLVVRFVIERMAAGYSIEGLAKSSDGLFASGIRRVENGEVTPELPTLIKMGQAAGLRLGWVPPHLEPLLALDEFEVRALVQAAGSGCGYMDCGQELDPLLMSALEKVQGGLHVDTPARYTWRNP